MTDLPTEAGSVIGLSTYYDGNHYSVAVLSYADFTGGTELAWWMGGFPDPIRQDEMATRLEGYEWHDLGKIPADRPQGIGASAK